ncbi:MULTISPECIES: hypothetical protein [Actinopolyspora]|uniref:hypothetical protein n=1 Tax=Actinopolyspora TaxID=1849 RepID=UPI001113F86F|nr:MULTISPECIES: hypothetical protein [Actinopolyspora]NHD16879.1 hypothetical protein [Actinopolyspora sp. BKK2]NHE76031.1 hypothetical protein [Actinopolyspora sp. BKK1]
MGKRLVRHVVWRIDHALLFYFSASAGVMRRAVRGVASIFGGHQFIRAAVQCSRTTELCEDEQKSDRIVDN